MEIIRRKHWKKLKSGALRGDLDAQSDLGYYCEVGARDKSGRILTVTDPVAAMDWYQAAAMQGHSGAQLALSNLLSADGVSQDFPQAIYWAKQAVRQGVSAAAFNLGTIYRDLGKPVIAFRWYLRAAALGDADALLQTGLCYLFGFGTTQNFESALSNFEKLLTVDANASSQRSKENARYWTSVLRLIRGPRTKNALAQIRDCLEAANTDDDHEPANDLLNLIGRGQS